MDIRVPPKTSRAFDVIQRWPEQGNAGARMVRYDARSFCRVAPVGQ